MEGSAWFANAGVVRLADRYGAKGFATWPVGMRFAATNLHYVRPCYQHPKTVVVLSQTSSYKTDISFRIV